MSNGISALEGFDYQAIVALELMLQHFDDHGPNARARPEGIDDLDLIHEDDCGITHRAFVQVKKPRQDADGLRTPDPWSLAEVVDALLTPRWTELKEERTQVCWVLGDALGHDAAALLGGGGDTSVWAARHAAAERVVRALRLTPVLNEAPEWRSPFRGSTLPTGTPDDARQQWTSSFSRRAALVGFDLTTIAAWTAAIEEAHAILDQVIHRVVPKASYAEAPALRGRVTQLLVDRFGLNELDVRNIVFRNLRGFVDDVARARGTWIDLPTLEHEILLVWPQRVATVQPPPMPRPHLPRPTWIRELAGRTGAVVGPSGSGKTTSATELYEYLRGAEPESVVLYAEVQDATVWRNVLEGVVHAVGRWGQTAPYKLLPSIRFGHDEALLEMADALEAVAMHTPIALLVDLVNGRASAAFARDLALFALRLPTNTKIRLWVFGQEDALSELSGVERTSRGLGQVPAYGLDWDTFLALAGLHGMRGRTELHRVYQALTAGRTTGVPPRTADAVLRLDSVGAALAAARSEDVLLAADAERYNRLDHNAQAVLGAVACLTHPFREDEAQAIFLMLPVKVGMRAGARAGLLHPFGDGRVEFHETVRRNVLAQLAPAVLVTHHARLADAYAAHGDKVLEAYHAEEAGIANRAREAGRAAFFNKQTADRVAERAVARGWVSPAEVLALLRDDPNGPYGWWRALHDGMDDETASALVAWWSEAVGKRGAQQVLWQAPRSLIAVRPDLLPELLDIVAATPEADGHYYGSSPLGVALRNHSFAEAVVLERFERETKAGRQALADCLRNSAGPGCLARWLAFVIEMDTPTRELSTVDITDAHVIAMLDAFPDSEPAHLLVQQDWGFGAATPFLWKNREALGAGAARQLQAEELAPRRVRVALRLLGLTGHAGLFEAARRWARREGQAQAMALTVPLLVDEAIWREELARLTLDPSIENSVRVAAYAMFVQTGEGSDVLLEEIVRRTPDLERVCRFTAGLSFVMRPALFSLDLLLDLIARESDEQFLRTLGTALARATYFADGPSARAVAERLVPLLNIPFAEIRFAVLHALTMLRQPVALEGCTRLALAEAGTPTGGMAAVAACASRPNHLSDVRAALEANPSRRWLIPALAARFQDDGAVSDVVGLAKDTGRHWRERRRALLTLERLPRAQDIYDVVDAVLAEQSLLGAVDSMNGQLSEMLARLMQDGPSLFASLLRQGETRFVDFLAETARRTDTLGPVATSEQIDACLRLVWRAAQATDTTGTTGGDPISTVLDRIQVLQVQSAALRVARTLGRVDVLEHVLASNDAPWLVFQALIERNGISPRTPDDAARWTRLISDRPWGTDPAIQAATANVLRPLLAPITHQRAHGNGPDAAYPVLAAVDLHALLDAEQPVPSGVRLADIDDETLGSLVARLGFEHDNVVVTLQEISDSSIRVSLIPDGAALRAPSIQSTGRKGDRSGLRARLSARFPDRVPKEWLESPCRGYNFTTALIDALADEGDPVRALAALRRLGSDSGDILRPRGNLYRLGQIADDALVNWVGALAGTGGAVEVQALASFARQAKADAVLTLLWRLMRRVDGQFKHKDAIVSREGEDPWCSAFADLLQANRLRDVPGAGEWLVGMQPKTRHHIMRDWIVEAMAAFPSTWSLVEIEALRTFEYAHMQRPAFRQAEELAQSLFWARRADDRPESPSDTTSSPSGVA